MYCDFCGKKLYSNVNYCRHCGQLLKDNLEDTQPLPVIDDTILKMAKQKAVLPLPWPNCLTKKQTWIDKFQFWKKIYALISLILFLALLYILATFKTIKEYQILTVILGGLIVIYTWRRH